MSEDSKRPVNTPASDIPAGGGGHGPPRGYSWPAFEEGNALAVRHGAYSERVTHPIAREIAAGVVADREHLAAYPEALWSWALAEAKVLVLEQWLQEHGGPIKADGDVQPAAKMQDRMMARADSLRGKLGLDPKSEAELAKARADAHRSVEDLETLRERGREFLDERGGLPWDDGGDAADG